MPTAINGINTGPETAPTTTDRVGNSALGKDDFLKLLMAQLQNQDPLNATSTTDFINQLTSYANFSEQQSINSSMTSLAGSRGSTSISTIDAASAPR